MKNNITLNIVASKSYAWSDDYDPDQPYNFTLSEFDHTGGSSWVVGKISVAYEAPAREHIIACQVHGLEQVLVEKADQHAKEMANIREQLDELRCIGFTPPVVEEVTAQDITEALAEATGEEEQPHDVPSMDEVLNGD